MRKSLLVSSGILAAAFVPSLASAHGIHANGAMPTVDFWQFLRLGVEHMLTGYDHLLFVLGITLFATRVRQVIKFITAFTLGHSATLIFAALAGITVNPLFIDAIIGLSVAYIGFEIVFGKQFRQRHKKLENFQPLFIIFVFGLLHGLGLATRLQDLTLPNEGLLTAILGFNLGVELGQLLALSLILLVVWLLKNLKLLQKARRPLGQALIAIGSIIFILLLVQAVTESIRWGSFS
jgi:hydrogenase/urease accessory protein HupE